RHLEIEHGRDGCGEALYVVVLNVSTILAQVRSDAVRAGVLADRRPSDGVGIDGTARLSQGRDVVDVDVPALAAHVVHAAVEEREMKKVIMSLVWAAACHSSPPTPAPTSTTVARTVPTGNATGAPDAVNAVRGFLAAAKEPDLQAMGVLFGDTQGPARDGLSR